MTTTWTQVPKATGTNWTNIPEPTSALMTEGSPIGLLLALTYTVTQGTHWSPISKASGTIWTDVPKAT